MSCKEEKEEDEEDYKMLNDNKSSNVATNNKNLKCKAIEGCVDEGDHKKSYKAVECASVQLVKDLKGDVDKACSMCEKLKEDSFFTEVMCETLVET